MGIFDNDYDPGMRYESLMRDAFDCSKWQDPFAYAAQDFYNEFIIEPTTLKGKRALSAGLIALIVKNKENEKLEPLVALENRVWTLTTQQEVISLIDEAIAMIN